MEYLLLETFHPGRFCPQGPSVIDEIKYINEKN